MFLRMHVNHICEWIYTCLYQNRTNELYLNQSQLLGNKELLKLNFMFHFSSMGNQSHILQKTHEYADRWTIFIGY